MRSEGFPFIVGVLGVGVVFASLASSVVVSRRLSSSPRHWDLCFRVWRRSSVFVTRLRCSERVKIILNVRRGANLVEIHVG